MVVVHLMLVCIRSSSYNSNSQDSVVVHLMLDESVHRHITVTVRILW